MLLMKYISHVTPSVEQSVQYNLAAFSINLQ